VPATAAFHPPEYQAQVRLAALSRSPMVSIVWLGMSWFAGVVEVCGVLTVKEVLTNVPVRRHQRRR